MSNEEQIEEILMEANSMGFRKELLERIKIIMDHDPTKNFINVLEREFQQIMNEIID